MGQHKSPPPHATFSPFPKIAQKKRMSGSIGRHFIFLAFFTFPTQITANRRINAVLRPAEKQDALQQAWHELLELRANQSAFAAMEFPIDHRLFGSLRKCGGPHSSLAISSSASMLSPRQIGIYAEIGHLTRICPERHFAKENAIELDELMANFRRDCTLSLSAHPQLPSLAQIFGAFGAQITLTHSEREHKDLQSWTREIVGQIQMMPGHHERWKLVVIAPGLHDIRPGQSPLRLAHSTLQAVHIIRHKLPRRTFLLILRHSYFAFWHTLARSSAFCAKVLDLWNWEEKERVDRAWEEVEARIATNFQSEDFYVEIADLMDQGRPLPTPDRMPDVSVLGPDCAHLSARGLSLLHSQLWNWLLQPQARMHPFVPLVRPLLCPRPHCPFLLTSTNRLSCPRLPPHSAAGMMGGEGSGSWLGRKPSAWTPLLALLLLATAFLLYALLAGCSLAPSFLPSSSSTHRERRESGGGNGGSLLISNRRQPISG